MKCSMGTGQAKLTVLPSRTVFLTGQPMANISDHLSMVNLAPFGRCRSLGFPATASATAANHGSLTPMPCMHNTPFPWMGGKNDYIVKGDPALLKSSTCQCMWGGTISLVTDGQVGEGTQWVYKKPRTDYTQKSLELKKGTFAFPPDQQHESKVQTEKASAVDFAKKVWDTVSPTIANINHKKGEFIDYVCDYVSDYVEQKAITVETFIKQKQEALTQAIKDANQFYDDAYNRIKEEIKTFLKTDKIILWDAYWEKQLIKETGQQSKLIPTKLRFIPQQIAVNLILVFYFKYDDAEHVKDTAEIVLRFDIPDTIYTTKEYRILGCDILKNEDGVIELNGHSHKLYKCSINNFSSDLTEVVFPDYFKEIV